MNDLYRRMGVGLCFVVVWACVVALWGPQARATDYTFVPGGANDWWMTPTNWNPVGVPNSVNDVVIFDASANPNYSTNVHSQWYTIQEMRFGTTSNWRIHNNRQDPVLDGPAGSAWINQNGSGAITFDTDLQLNDTTTIGGTGTGNITVNGSIMPVYRNGVYGAGGLIKEGSYVLTLNPALQYAGPTTVNQGTLRLAGGVGFPSAGSSGKFTSPHTLNVNGGGTLQVNGDWITGDGLVNQINVNGGTLQFLNSDNYMGNITLTGGAITTSGGNRPWRTGNWGSGLITVNPSAATSTISGSLCFVGTAAAPVTTFDVADGPPADDLVLSALIYDHPGFERRMRLVKDGPGKMVLSNNGNTFAGGVTINDGTLSITSLSGGNTPSALGASYGTAPMLVFNGGTLEYTGGTVGGINRAFTINAGGATLDIANAGTTVTWTDAAGAGPIVGAGTLTKDGPGTLVLASPNSYAGGTLLDGGTLLVGHVNALGPGAATVNSGATLDLAGYNVANDITLNGGTLYTANGASGTITLNNVPGNTINANGYYRVLSGRITGPGGFAMGGVNTPGIALSNPANDFQGDVTINANSYLRVNANEVIPDTANVTIDGYLRLEGPNRTETIAAMNGSGHIFAVGSGNTLRVGATDASGAFSGFVGAHWDPNVRDIHLVKIGAGTQTLSNTLYHVGGTTVDGGTVNLNQGGVPFPSLGATGQFNSAHTVTVNNGGTLRLNATWVTGDGLANKVVVNEGGTLAFVDSDNYLGNIELTGGAITTSGGTRPWRTGNWGNGLITVGASATPSTIDGSLYFVGTGAATETRFDVAAGAEVLMSANVYDHPGPYGGMALVKDGPGKMVLSGNNTYVGPTIVEEGTLLIDGTHTGGDTYTVAGGATLGGSGSFDAEVSFAADSILAPGSSVGLLTTGGLTTGSDFHYLWDLAGAPIPGTDYDSVQVNGDLAFGANPTLEVFDLSPAGFDPGPHRFVLFSYTGTLSGAAAAEWTVDLSAAPGFQRGQVVYDQQNKEVLLTGLVVPEPGTLLIWAGLLALGIGARRRRKENR